MDNCLLNNKKEKRIQDSSVDSDYLDKLFIYVSNNCDRFYQLILAYKKEIGNLSVFSRIKVKKDFKLSVGVSIDEVEALILEANNVWQDIKRAINANNLDMLETSLRTYTYNRTSITSCLYSFADYNQELKLKINSKDKTKIDTIENLLEELKEVTKDLNRYLEEIYQMLKLSD